MLLILDITPNILFFKRAENLGVLAAKHCKDQCPLKIGFDLTDTAKTTALVPHFQVNFFS